MGEKLHTAALRNRKISHREILEAAVHVSGFADLYRQKVLTEQTRTIRLLGRKSPAKVIHTLLGFEVQACYKRIHCPDMVTARYIRLFSELGCRSIKLPYDPTRTAHIIPEFEAMMERIAGRIRELFPQDHRTQRYVFRKVYAIIRGQLKAI
jgi:hypothetical protein